MVVKSRLLDFQSLLHGFGTRQGGNSKPPFMSLNCCYNQGDDHHIVSQNRIHLAQAIADMSRPIATLTQVHGNKVITLTTPVPPALDLVGDGLVTDQRGILIGVTTADCVPVLLADPVAGVVGACHAGWRGAAQGITTTTVTAMEALGAQPQRIVAALGPSIQAESYEVDDRFTTEACAHDPNIRHYLSPKLSTNRYCFDLPAYVIYRLRALGIATIDVIPLNTYTLNHQFYSYRFSSHQNPGAPVRTGRQLSLIGLA
jgi:YfiH family protein